MTAIEYEDMIHPIDEDGYPKVSKSNYGPKGAAAYSAADNAQRKMKNTGEEVEGVGQNKNVKTYTSAPKGTAKQQAATEARHYAKLNRKQPVKTISIEEYKRQKGLIKAETLSISPNGQWSLT